jgi:hypothetical protein
LFRGNWWIFNCDMKHSLEFNLWFLCNFEIKFWWNSIKVPSEKKFSKALSYKKIEFKQPIMKIRFV